MNNNPLLNVIDMLVLSCIKMMGVKPIDDIYVGKLWFNDNISSTVSSYDEIICCDAMVLLGSFYPPYFAIRK